MSEFGSPHSHYRSTDSTNTRARELASAGAPGGTIVTAAEQTAGRGRQGRSWTAPAGKALLYSTILRPLDRRHLLLPLSVPVAVCEVAEELEPAVRCQIKWPNDIWIEGRKVAGVLIEARPQDGWAVIGVGLNLAIERDEFPLELRDTAASLFASAVPYRRYSDMQNTATRVVSEQLSRWTEAGDDEVLTAWRERDALKGREVGWEGGSGVADGIDERGNLVVRVAGGEIVALGAGEVHLRL